MHICVFIFLHFPLMHNADHICEDEHFPECAQCFSELSLKRKQQEL